MNAGAIWMVATRTFFVGFDVGGTKIAAGVANGDGRFLDVVRMATPPAGELVDLLSATVQHFVERLRAMGAHLGAVGVGIPGQVRDGVVRQAVNLGIDECPLRDLLAMRVGVPVVVENDTSAAALGAFHLLQQREPLRSLVYLGIGTGFSAGIVLDGHVYRGANGLAGEIGHVVVDPDGAPCACGARGCLETVVSGTGLARQAQIALVHVPESLLAEAQPLDARAVYAAARQGDRLAQHLVERSAAMLAQAIAWLVFGLDVDKVVLGGGVAREADVLLPIVRRALRAQYGHSRLFDLFRLDEKLTVLSGETEAGMVGAWALAHAAREKAEPQSEKGGGGTESKSA